MEYLVLHTFRSYGRTLRKGEVVDESAVRSPRLRLAERKIVVAKEEPLLTAAPGAEPETTDNAVISSGEPEQPVVAAPAAQVPQTKEESKKSVKLSFGL